MKKEKKARHFRRKPQYPGGQQAMKDFLRKQLQYPPEALAAGIEGSVLVQFTINHAGSVIHTQLISGIGYGCDEEAERIVRLLQFEADKNRGFKTANTQTLGIHFHLPQQKQSEAMPTSITYEYTPRSAETKNETDGQTYQYSIEW